MALSQIALLVSGIAVLVVVSADFLFSTVGSSGRFTMSDRIGRGVFAVLRALSRLGGNRVLTQISGVAVLSAVAGFWILGALLGWSLIYRADPSSVTMGPPGIEPEAIDYPAHVGHLLSTLGGATTQPGGPLWNWIGVFVGLNGMVMLTLAVSFLLSVRQTVQQGRTLATLVQTGPPDVDHHVERVAEVISGLHAAPHALWYGHVRADRRLPDALLALARQGERAGGATAARMRDLMADLPHWGAVDGERFLDRMEAWAAMHRLHRDDGAERGERVAAE